MKVVQRIQAHPDRAAMAHALAAEVGGDVCYDPDPDNKTRHPWRTLRHLLTTADPAATHIGHLQDDTVVCDRYAEAVERAVHARPDRLLVFYVGDHGAPHARALMAACDRDEPWVELPLGQWIPCLAMVWPREMAADIVAWDAAASFPPRFGADDERIGRWCNRRQVRPLASVPSLADHRDDLPSLLRGHNRLRPLARQAACFIGTGCGTCALEIDWTAGPR